MSIVNAYKCSCCGKLYDVFNKKRYVEHLKSHAGKRIIYKKIKALCDESSNKINELFLENISFNEFIKIALENYTAILSHIYKEKLSTLMMDVNRESPGNIDIHYHRLIRKYYIPITDLKFMYSDKFNKKLVDGKDVSDCGIAISYKNRDKPIPKAFFVQKRKYARIGKFRYYVYSEFNSASIIMVVLFDPDDVKSKAAAKLYSE